jgi:hypothetical protein
MTIDELKTAYMVITKIMDENRLQKDNSFNRVRNFISNKLCDNLIEKEKK